MKVLLVAYVMSNPEGDSLIGVYKRCLRIGMELVQRGHEVYVFCTGRERFLDHLTESAARNFRFLDFTLKLLFPKSVTLKRRYFRRLFAKLRFDLVVIGEMPLAGTLLDATLCAVELGVPVVFLDNAYSPDLARLFWDVHGTLADALVLTGPSSFQMSDPRPTLCQVPPFIKLDTAAAQRTLLDIGIQGRSLITVLAYETKAEKLATRLLCRLQWDKHALLFLTANKDACRQRLRELLPDALMERVRIFEPRADSEFFGFVKLSRLVIGKCGFMQVSESLTLSSPFIGVYYRGCFQPDLLPEKVRPFVHATTSVEPDAATIAAASRFLTMQPADMAGIHEGPFGSTETVADFLESVRLRPAEEKSGECERLGYSRATIERALAARHPGRSIRIQRMRAGRLRNLRDSRIDSIVCLYQAGDRRMTAHLWGRVYNSAEAAQAEIYAASQQGSSRRILNWSAEQKISIEIDVGEPVLPPLEI
jgi:hypothetical protein